MKNQIKLIYRLYFNSETPLIAKLIASLTLGLALSPVDFIPDFIPVLGYLDDFIFIPVGVYLTLKLTPNHVIERCKQVEGDENSDLPTSKTAGIIITMFWVFVIVWLSYYFMNEF